MLPPLPVIVGQTGGDLVYGLPRLGLGAVLLVAHAAVGARVPGVQVDHAAVHPGAVSQAQVLHGDAHDPVRAGDHLGDKREQVLGGVHPEHGEGSPHNVGPLLQTLGLDHAADVLGGPLHVVLELPGVARLGQHLQGGRGQLPVLPEVVVDAVAGPDHLGEGGLPLVAGEVLGVGVAGPETLEDDLVLGLVTRLTRAHHRGGRLHIALADGVGQSCGKYYTYRVFFFLWIQSGGCKTAILRSFKQYFLLFA